MACHFADDGGGGIEVGAWAAKAVGQRCVQRVAAARRQIVSQRGGALNKRPNAIGVHRVAEVTAEAVGQSMAGAAEGQTCRDSSGNDRKTLNVHHEDLEVVEGISIWQAQR